MTTQELQQDAEEALEILDEYLGSDAKIDHAIRLLEVVVSSPLTASLVAHILSLYHPSPASSGPKTITLVERPTQSTE